MLRNISILILSVLATGSACFGQYYYGYGSGVAQATSAVAYTVDRIVTTRAQERALDKQINAENHRTDVYAQTVRDQTAMTTNAALIQAGMARDAQIQGINAQICQTQIQNGHMCYWNSNIQYGGKGPTPQLTSHPRVVVHITNNSDKWPAWVTQGNLAPVEIAPGTTFQSEINYDNMPFEAIRERLTDDGYGAFEKNTTCDPAHGYNPIAVKPAPGSGRDPQQPDIWQFVYVINGQALENRCKKIN